MATITFDELWAKNRTALNGARTIIGGLRDELTAAGSSSARTAAATELEDHLTFLASLEPQDVPPGEDVLPDVEALPDSPAGVEEDGEGVDRPAEPTP